MRRTTTSVGGMEDGYVPNITGLMNGGLANGTTPSGVFYVNFTDGWGAGVKGATENYLGFDASRSNAAYVNDNLVIPRNLNIGGWIIKY